MSQAHRPHDEAIIELLKEDPALTGESHQEPAAA